MHQFRFIPGQRKNLFFNVGLAAMIAVPMFTQPFGLALAPTDPVANVSSVQKPALYEMETKSPASLESLQPQGDLEIALNRSSEETDAIITQHEASRSVELTLGTPITAVKPYTVRFAHSGVNFRSRPSTSSAIIKVLNRGAKLTVTGETAGWKRVKDATGKTGYVASKFLSTASSTQQLTATRTIIAPKAAVAKTTTAAPTNNSSSKVVSVANSMLGVPYVFGSESRSGVDCSGLILYCYKQAGIYVPRTAASYASFGTAVSLANIQPGDVIVMDAHVGDGVTNINHVGLYVGGGYMIHASSSNGKVVKANLAQYIGYGVKVITVRRIRG